MQCGATCEMQGGKRSKRSKRIQGGNTIAPLSNISQHAGLMKIRGGCGCNKQKGGYKPTKRNLKALRKWKQGKSIGFTMRSSLKAKGLIPRANGTLRVSPKYAKKPRKTLKFHPRRSIEIQQPYEYSPLR